MSDCSDTWVIQGIKHWQFFGSFTFRQERLPLAVRKAMFFALGRELSRWHHVDFSRLLWVLRLESGEITGRLHFHALIGGIPPYAMDVSSCKALEHTWLNHGGGWAKVRVYDEALHGPEYVNKCLTDDSDIVDMVGANAYERAKFDAAQCHLMIAKSVVAVGMSNARRNGEVMRRLLRRPMPRAVLSTGA